MKRSRWEINYAAPPSAPKPFPQQHFYADAPGYVRTVIMARLERRCVTWGLDPDRRRP